MNRFESSGLTDVGQKRENNEDSFLCDRSLGLYMVCDGMGGHQAGEVASRMAVDIVARQLEESHANFADLVKTEDGQQALLSLVETAVERACKEIYQQAAQNPKQRGMGTTLTLLLVLGEKAIMAHVGDSRLYLYRAGAIDQLSHDHTFVATLVQNGVLSPEDAKRHPYANVLTRCLGIQESVLVDTLLFDVLPGDTFMLCSDGLAGALESSEELTMLLDERDVTKLPQTLVDIANVRGGSDNITCVVVRAKRAPADTLLEADFNLTPERQIQLNVMRSLFLCHELRMDGLLRVLNLCDVNAVGAGEMLQKQGERIDYMTVVVKGALREQGPIGARDVGVGEHSGASGLLQAHKSNVDLIAKENTWYLRVNGERFLRLTQRRPSLGVRLLRNLGVELSRELVGAGGD